MKRAGLLLGVILLGSCNKVPITDINAGFALADATWFAQEQTLFIFYRLSAEQGLGPESQLELTWRTDKVFQDWTPLQNLTMVHTHVPVSCGLEDFAKAGGPAPFDLIGCVSKCMATDFNCRAACQSQQTRPVLGGGPMLVTPENSRCGSASVKVVEVPRQVGIRLRYHRDGELTLTPATALNVIDFGPAHTHRSLVVYGVFEEQNNTVQWRARHQFPALRNLEVQQLGLRREFRILDPRAGNVAAPKGNPYGYAFAPSCPASLTPLGWGPLVTQGRAIFDTNKLPLEQSAALGVCAQSVVIDAKGTFSAAAIARKNPEVRPAFPSLRSPIRANTPVGFLLRPCGREISKVHRQMQVQRLQLEASPEICIDNWKDPNFPNVLANAFRTRVDAVRAIGNDMVLTISIHHDDTTGQLGLVIEKALEQLLPFEQAKASPRASGALIFDTFKHATQSPALRRLVLWCPGSIDAEDLDKIPEQAQRYCPLRPDFPDLNLGPFKFSTLPILPTRPQYLTLIGKYSEGQAGSVTQWTFLAPERTAISQNIPFQEYGVSTFFNNEVLTAAPGDAFSYCAGGDARQVYLPDGGSALPDGGLMTEDRAQYVVFRSPFIPTPLPLSALPQLHSVAPSPSYQLGLLWDFPFLPRLEYQITIAGAVTAFSATLPFGFSAPTEQYWGISEWKSAEFPLSNTLKQCTRFCDHPTFMPAPGTYEVNEVFRVKYQNQCYLPRFPVPIDGEFPHDP